MLIANKKFLRMCVMLCPKEVNLTHSEKRDYSSLCSLKWWSVWSLLGIAGQARNDEVVQEFFTHKILDRDVSIT